MNSLSQYLDLYEAHRELLCSAAAPVTNGPREWAAERLREVGLPTTRTERYKYTDAAAAFAPDFGLNLRRIGPEHDPYERFKCQVPNLSTSLFFVMNDMPCVPTDAARRLLPEGVVVESFARAEGRIQEVVAAHYNRAADHDRDFRQGHDGVTLLNTLLAQDGLLIYLPKDTQLKAPIQVVNVSTARHDLLSLRRVLIVAEEGAHGAILFCDHAEGDTAYLTSEVVEVVTAKDAAIDLYTIEETNARNRRFHTVYTRQDERSHVACHDITLTCGLTRNRLDARLQGSGAHCRAFGAVIADAAQSVDHNILIEHMAPRCESTMLHKYVLGGESRGAFAGKVYVAPGAQQTLSQQTNANLCTTPAARAFSQPMLEIYADDVKCNHGSTTGKMDDAALFYMRQRGIAEDEARLLLQHAFINEVLREVTIPHLYDRLAYLAEQRFRGNLNHCKGCRHQCGTH